MSEKEEKAAVAVAVAEAKDVTGEKQGKKCCGCCCDFRRAVIVLAIIGIVQYAIYLITTAVGVGFGATMAANAEDDDVVRMAGTGVAIGSGIAAGIFAIAMCFYIFQLFAALKYNVCMLATVIVFDLLSLAYDIYYTSVIYETSGEIIAGIIINCVVAGLFIYPTAGLLMEINAGTMSEATYPREAYSCCCEPKV